MPRNINDTKQNNSHLKSIDMTILATRKLFKSVKEVLAVGAIAFVMSAPTLVQAGDNSGMGQSYYAGLSCGQLWYERNRIFAAAGYCFTTPRALRVFGPRCYPPYGRLAPHRKAVVNEIRYWERRRGC